mmetsp:Transcript_59169/g.175857  ORF Transcript_59169/g.175857 Transcript_59169/m.175857 type:complete len:206 (-) Transcript_59169:245-862(-)
MRLSDQVLVWYFVRSHLHEKIGGVSSPNLDVFLLAHCLRQERAVEVRHPRPVHAMERVRCIRRLGEGHHPLQVRNVEVRSTNDLNPLHQPAPVLPPGARDDCPRAYTYEPAAPLRPPFDQAIAEFAFPKETGDLVAVSPGNYEDVTIGEGHFHLLGSHPDRPPLWLSLDDILDASDASVADNALPRGRSEHSDDDGPLRAGFLCA